MSDKVDDVDARATDWPVTTVMDEKTTYVLEVKKDGSWHPFTAQKSDPVDVVRTYAFGKSRDPDEQIRIIEIHTKVSLIDIAELESIVPSKTDG